METKGRLKKHRAWLFLLVGALLLVVVDRVYVFNLSAHSAYEKFQKTAKPKAEEHNANSPMFAVVADIEEFLEAHEKLFIVLSTIAIAGFTFTLWRATDGLFVMARKQAEDMRQSLSIAKDSADAATESTKLSRADFASTHRPRLIVRRIYFRSDSAIAYEVANIGATGAEILGVKQVLFFDKLPTGGPDDGASTHIGANYIHAGTYFEFIHAITDAKVLAELRFSRGIAIARVPGTNKPIIYFCGHVAYKDHLGVGRRTAFCRIYDFGTERFMPIPNADQDYEHVD